MLMQVPIEIAFHNMESSPWAEQEIRTRIKKLEKIYDLHNAIHEAFRIAEDQLGELKKQREGRTRDAQHDAENQFLGQVAERNPEQDFGFLLTKEGGLLYFHRNSVLSGDFDKLIQGDEVYYVEDVGDTGPTAIKVRVKEKD